jgi:predicted nucleotide-binding protein (sugar kinase/HSP70/actin superfamily)
VTKARSPSRRIGIPRALYDFDHPKLWETFFRALGHTVVRSRPTAHRTLERATAISEAEHCLPVKLLDAHVDEIADDIDLLFVPRILSTVKGHLACPKMGACPDAIAATFDTRCEILTVEIDAQKRPLEKSLMSLGKDLGATRHDSLSAARVALAAMDDIGDSLVSEKPTGNGPRLLILGHPYCLHDRFISQPILGKLASMNVICEVFSHLAEDSDDSFIHWDVSNKMHHRLQRITPDEFSGVLQISTFNCGCDSMMVEFFREIVTSKGIPYLVLILDEHSAQGGIDTRLEAFLDSLDW